MKNIILFVESGIGGHRKKYHKELIEAVGAENSILITPQYENDILCKQVVNEKINLKPRKINEYEEWLKYIKKVADNNSADVIHILDGDLLYKFWGVGLKQLNDYKIVVTYHHIKNDFFHTISLNRISKHITYGVVHTRYLKERFKKIPNIILINYPYLGEDNLPNKDDARKYFGIEHDAVVFSTLGGTRYEKGADILVKSFMRVKNEKAILLIAGAEENFKKSDLMTISGNSKKVIYYMNKLTNDEWLMAISASDYVVLPYRKTFTGASGPLTDAVWFNRGIIGTMSESVGDVIKSNSLGYLFECESEDSLSETIEKAARQNWNINNDYLKFRTEISSEKFRTNYKKLYY